MKILRLEADSFQRLKAVDITPTGNLIQITGKNAQGKTSCLDAIWAALCGADHIHVQPINANAKKARIRLDLGELVVTRKFSEKGTTLTVENSEGLSFKSPQRMLDDLVGALAFDPLAFTRMKPREQFDQVKNIAQLDVDVEKLDGQNRGDFERRTIINRDLKTAQAQLDTMIAPSEVLEPVDISALIEQQQRLNTEKNAAQLAYQQRAAKQQRADTLRQELDEIRQTFAKKKEALATLEDELAGLATPEVGPDLDGMIQDINTQIRNAQQTNEAAAEARRAAERFAELKAKVSDLQKQADALTESMEARTKAKQEAIARAKMPVEGLGFGDGLVLYNGIPFEQASGAEQLRVSVAIAIAANPKLRVIRVQDGSLLDDTSLQILADMAQEHDMQVWIEQVSNTRDIGIVIEDGEVVANNQQPQHPVAVSAEEKPAAVAKAITSTLPELE